MEIKRILTYLILITLLSCDALECNYQKLSESEYKIIAALNQNKKRIDTMFNDECLRGYLHVYIKEKSTDLDTDNEIKQILLELKKENMQRDIWVFNSSNKFLHRFFWSNVHGEKGIMKTDLQYPNQ
ncbi:MAG: hypothetical protein COA80_02070 [Leeuwenhoekiella sp.]|uniref:Lipoprotein n=1 Tax=Leeuwenhoekiella nanhaiensis TaxID=1655491 RepID=A0A2G1VQ41_9FLAO|nr:hypothetical protein [Leeuwenhoekiella nanhaiensis]PHQ28864.1 hypothetical protein CJ305_11750 [Leeuwenhoekiella nanhaiensis]PHS01549.1 MAG: hypothetical protein COA80_02070 [Leeuwenhoekiella sp.]